MSHGKADLHRGNHPVTMQAPLQADLRDKALKNLREMYGRGQLMPVTDVSPLEGTILDVYIDILGLNDRALKDSVRLR